MIERFLNANSEINIDIVNPMPASIPVPKICFLRISFGIEHHPKATPAIENKNIPMGFPSNNPRNIPKLFEPFNALIESEEIRIAVFANANSGRIINATGLCK